MWNQFLSCGEALHAGHGYVGAHRAAFRAACPGHGDPAASGRIRDESAPPALTLTVNIPLTDDGLSPQAHKLIEAVRELVEMSSSEVTTPVVESAPEGTGIAVKLLTATRQVVVGDQELPLTRLEFDLLLFLADHPRRVFTRAQLLAGVWGYEHTGERTVDVHVRRLRVKLGSQVPLITTVYGVGYRLSDEARIVVVPEN